jgi:serine/threonine-protein kinase
MQQPWLAAGRYEVGEVVGQGGYGMVCRGVDRQTGRAVALKMLSREAGRDPDVVERMLREQQALVALTGTCAVTAIDLCRLESGAPCLVMEWLDGRDLEQQLTAWEAEQVYGDLSYLLAVVRPLAETLERAHQIGIVHRDIKPANIFLTNDARAGVRLLDFGLSRMKSAAPLTAVGMVMGSPSYIAPETWRGNSTALDGRADWFALAVIVFRWLTGRLPFDAPDLIAKMTAVTSGPRPSALALRPDLPAAIDAWLNRALAIEPDARFQSGSEFHDALSAALRGEQWRPAAEVSGVQPIATVSLASESTTRKGAFATAWGAAAALLKRFTAPRDAEPAGAAPMAAEAPRPAAPAVPASLPGVAPAPELAAPPLGSPPLVEASEASEAPASERLSVWLDSGELEELGPVPPEPAPVAAPEAKAKRKGAQTPAAKARARPKAKSAAKRKPKPAAKAAKRAGRDRAKGTRKARSKARKA